MASRAQKELELLKLQEEEYLYEQSLAQPAQAAPVAEVAPVAEDAANPVRGAVQTTLQGITSGAGDEIAGFGRALIDPLVGALAGEENVTDGYFDNFGDRMDMYIDDERANIEDFAETNSGLATGLDIAGSFANPLNYVAPGLTLAKGALGTAGKVAARSALEGGAEGYLRGEGDNRLSSAGVGAGVGGALGGSIGGLGKALSKRRIADDLVDKATGVQTPLNMADPEGRLGKLYRNIVGGSFGGRGIIGKQESAALAANPKIQSLVDDVGGELAQTTGTRNAVNDIQDRVVQRAKADRTASREGLTNTLAKLDDDAAKALSDAEVRKAGEQFGAGQVADKAGDQLRRNAALNATPEANRTAVLKDIDLGDPQAVSERLNRFWKSGAFNEVKGRKFKWDDGIKKRLRGEMDADPAFKNAIGNELRSIDRMREKLGSAADIDGMSGTEFIDALMSGKITGKIVDAKGNPLIKQTFEEIDGDVLMEIRNVFARGANKSSGMDSYAQRQFAKSFDKGILAQLDDAGKKGYADQLNRYTDYLSYRDAARKAVSKGGLFDDKDLTRAAAKFGEASEGRIPHAEALNVARGTREAAERTGKSSAPMAAAKNSETRSVLAKAKREARKKAQNRAKRISQRETAAKNRLARSSGNLLPEDSSFWSMAATTAALGSPFAALGVGSIPAGAAVSSLLGSKGAQRLAAGQTGLQGKLRNNEELLSLILRGASRTAGGQAGEN